MGRALGERAGHRLPTARAPARQVTFETLLMVARQRKNQTVIEATGVAHQRREQALGNAQVRAPWVHTKAPTAYGTQLARGPPVTRADGGTYLLPGD